MTDDRLTAYLAHIRDAALLARSYVENMSWEEFLADTRTQQAVASAHGIYGCWIG